MIVEYEARPYGRYVYLITSEAEYIELKGEELPLSECVGFTQWDDDHNVIIFVNDGNMATLVHEIVHASLFILEYVGIDAHSNNGECQAYLVDNMFSHFSEAISNGNK